MNEEIGNDMQRGTSIRPLEAHGYNKTFPWLNKKKECILCIYGFLYVQENVPWVMKVLIFNLRLRVRQEGVHVIKINLKSNV